MRDDPTLLADPISWGHELIRTRDIDPVYDMLVGARLQQDQLMRWLLTYWCLYSVGAASKISERQGNDFWGLLYQAAENVVPVEVAGQQVRWPRSTERRHWRGKAAVNCVIWLAQNNTTPELAVDRLFGQYGNATTSVDSTLITERVQAWPSFGPWIGFKVADMMERVMGVPVQFSVDVAFYETPKAGLKLAAGEDNTEYGYVSFIQRMIDAYKHLSPPGLPTRNINVQEIETCLCKFKSARGSHYYIGKDTHEIRHALVGWGETAERLTAHVPQIKSLESQAEPLTAR